MNINLHVRQAVLDDCDKLTEIAHASKRFWDYPEDWIIQWRPVLTIAKNYLDENLIFVGEMDNRIVGFYALVRETNSLELDHFWIHPDFIGRGIGRALFNHVVLRVEVMLPGSDLKIISDPNAEPFYLHMGALRTGTVSTDWGGMSRTLPLLRFSTARGPQES